MKVGVIAVLLFFLGYTAWATWYMIDQDNAPLAWAMAVCTIVNLANLVRLSVS